MAIMTVIQWLILFSLVLLDDGSALCIYTIYLVYILTALLIRNQITNRAQREEKRKELLRDSKESLQSYLHIWTNSPLTPGLRQ